MSLDNKMVVEFSFDIILDKYTRESRLMEILEEFDNLISEKGYEIDYADYRLVGHYKKGQFDYV